MCDSGSLFIFIQMKSNNKKIVKSQVLAKNPLKFRVYNRPISDTDNCVGRCWLHLKERKK